MSHFRRYIVPALEADTVVQEVVENKEEIVDPSAVVESVVDPAVANPEPVKTEAPEATPAPAAPVVEAPKEDGESGATDTTQTADESAAAAVQTPARNW